ncbi:uncharacterized protein CANTADRAFT_26867 [Suhomyces tanzawaensis NRRL Y-17324]|uniref:Transcription elongation factor Eaf N-terminal domain-containing protein n=1 Tax=Suhomyces tanzawaensis NRRL Y-17324 TaxID=984487 RepID=A0A1E4SED2_9ASCO|nr:uncharacterized protein CANTADRAFT_26867 [Suhomyces tanzawaensis NRRL Y-17324]ODV77843.1 hypothetical protein CANTADRAFT_26867 [Suhomyces tanzawaensis NRRL Y-17324]
MSLADGEYEIDLNELLNISTIAPINESENIAIRYGFVPDLMDQTKPLRLYQNDQECLLKANSNEGPEKPIIFEGLTQKHRGNDAFYLTYNPAQASTVLLKRLNSTIRFSKSRNASKLQTKLDQWEKDVVEKETKRMNRKKEKSPATLAAPTTPNNPSSRSSLSAKRPPTANNTPEPKKGEPIISESDFDDLNDFEFDEPKPRASKKPPVKKISKPTPDKETRPKILAGQKTQPKAPTKRSKKVKSAPIIERADRDDSMDIDDDFKDLEDQLQEVLEEESKSSEDQLSFEEKPQADNGIKFDSDESDFDDYQFPGIKINVEENDTQPSRGSYSDTYSNSASNQKPMSLRDLIGAGKKSQDDDMSSSEEE